MLPGLSLDDGGGQLELAHCYHIGLLPHLSHTLREESFQLDKHMEINKISWLGLVLKMIKYYSPHNNYSLGETLLQAFICTQIQEIPMKLFQMLFMIDSVSL